MRTDIQFRMLKNALLHQFFLLFWGHILLLEMEGDICFLDYNGTCHTVLFFEHAAEDTGIAVVFAALHLYVVYY